MGETEGLFKHIGASRLFIALFIACTIGLFVAPAFSFLNPFSNLVKSIEGYVWAVLILSFCFAIAAYSNEKKITKAKNKKNPALPIIPFKREVVKENVDVAKKKMDESRREAEKYQHLTTRQKAILAFYFAQGNRFQAQWLYPDDRDVDVLTRIGHIKRLNTRGTTMTGYAYGISDITYDYYQKNFNEINTPEVLQTHEKIWQGIDSPIGQPY